MFKRISLLAFLGVSSFPGLAAEVCPSGISLPFKAFSSKATQAKSLKVSYTLANKSKFSIRGSSVTIGLDEDVSFNSANNQKQHGSTSSSPAFDSDANKLTWTKAGSLEEKGFKSSKKFQATVEVGNVSVRRM